MATFYYSSYIFEVVLTRGRPAVDPRETRDRPAKNIREGVGGEILIFVLFWEDVKGRERSQSAAANFTMKEKRLSNKSLMRSHRVRPDWSG